MCLNRLAIGERPEISYLHILSMNMSQILDILALPLDHEDYRYVTKEECFDCMAAKRCPDTVNPTDAE